MIEWYHLPPVDEEMIHQHLELMRTVSSYNIDAPLLQLAWDFTNGLRKIVPVDDITKWASSFDDDCFMKKSYFDYYLGVDSHQYLYNTFLDLVDEVVKSRKYKRDKDWTIIAPGFPSKESMKPVLDVITKFLYNLPSWQEGLAYLSVLLGAWSLTVPTKVFELTEDFSFYDGWVKKEKNRLAVKWAELVGLSTLPADVQEEELVISFSFYHRRWEAVMTEYATGVYRHD